MCIFDGLPFRRFRSQVPGDPKKIIGGVRELLGARQPTFRLLGGRYTLHCVSGEATGSLWGPLKKKDLSLKWVKQVFFMVPICPWAGVVAFIQRVCP